MTKKICILLSKYERQLVSDYGYPFEEISDQLEANENLDQPVVIEAAPFWMEKLLGDLSRSINHQEIPNQKTENAVNEIAERIELALGIN